MNEVWAHRSPADKSLLGVGVSSAEPTLEAPCLVRDADTDEPVMLVSRYPGDLTVLRRALLSYPMSSTPRALGIRNKSAVFGYVGRRALMKRDGCRSCSKSKEAPEQHAAIAGAAGALARQLAETLPGVAALGLAASDVVLPEWKLEAQSPWTSGVVNWLSPLPYHYDRNNLAAWSAMPIVRRGVRGGHLHVPEYGLVVPCRDGDVVYFAGWDLMHGVTPMTSPEDDGYRVTAVYYAVEDMKHCLGAADELLAGQRRRTSREDDLVARQREQGLLR